MATTGAPGALSQQLLRTEDIYTDFKIICGSDIYYVHRVVLLCHSDWFKTLFKSYRYENQPHVRTVRLNKDDSTFVKAMIDFIYLADYQVPSQHNPLAFQVNMFETGVYFMTPDLRRQAKEKLDREIHMDCPIEWISEMIDMIDILSKDKIRKPLRESCGEAAIVHLRKVKGNAQVPRYLVHGSGLRIDVLEMVDLGTRAQAGQRSTPSMFRHFNQYRLVRLVSSWLRAMNKTVKIRV